MREREKESVVRHLDAPGEEVHLWSRFSSLAGHIYLERAGAGANCRERLAIKLCRCREALPWGFDFQFSGPEDGANGDEVVS